MILNELNADLIKEIFNALEGINFGSVEIVVQDGEVTQVSTRNIKKTKLSTKLKQKTQVSINL